MSDSYTELNATTGGTKVDDTSLTVSSTIVRRSKVEVGGTGASEIIRVKNTSPASSDYGLTIRHINTGSTITTGRKSSIGTSAVQITSTSVTSLQGVQIKAADTNTDRIYVGFNGVTANSGDASDGTPLAAGDSILFQANNVNLLYVVAASGSQKLFFMTVN